MGSAQRFNVARWLHETLLIEGGPNSMKPTEDV